MVENLTPRALITGSYEQAPMEAARMMEGQNEGTRRSNPYLAWSRRLWSRLYCWEFLRIIIPVTSLIPLCELFRIDKPDVSAWTYFSGAGRNMPVTRATRQSAFKLQCQSHNTRFRLESTSLPWGHTLRTHPRHTLRPPRLQQRQGLRIPRKTPNTWVEW